MAQGSFTLSIYSKDAAIQQCPSFYKIHIDISKNRSAKKQWKAQPENCLWSWYESVASVGFEQAERHIQYLRVSFSQGHFTYSENRDINNCGNCQIY